MKNNTKRSRVTLTVALAFVGALSAGYAAASPLTDVFKLGQQWKLSSSGQRGNVPKDITFTITRIDNENQIDGGAPRTGEFPISIGYDPSDRSLTVRDDSPENFVAETVMRRVCFFDFSDSANLTDGFSAFATKNSVNNTNTANIAGRILTKNPQATTRQVGKYLAAGFGNNGTCTLTQVK